MASKPRILLDVDGPLTAGFFIAACDILCELGVDAHPLKIDQWDIFKAFNTPPLIETTARMHLRSDGVALTFAPNAGAKYFVDNLREWADVYAVTAPLDGSPTWACDRERWLQKHFEFPLDHIVSVRDKSLIAGDALIDDKAEHLDAWQAVNPDGLAILWMESHNKASVWSGAYAAYYDTVMVHLEPLRPKGSSR